METQILGKQLLRSGTFVGAQYREARRAKSTADLISKIESSLQELVETAYWLELEESDLVKPENISGLRQVAEELTAVFVAIAKSVKSRKSK